MDNLGFKERQIEIERLKQNISKLAEQRGSNPEMTPEESFLRQQFTELTTPASAEPVKMQQMQKAEEQIKQNAPIQISDRSAWKNFSPDVQQYAMQLFPSLKQFESPEQPQVAKAPEAQPSEEPAAEREPAAEKEPAGDNRFPVLLGDVLEREGGYRAKVKGDHATMSGITLPIYRQYKNDPNLTEEDLKKMTEEDRNNIYKRYYNEVGGSQISDPRTSMILFDQNVNKGTRFINDIQEIFGHPKSAKLQKETIDAINSLDPDEFNKSVLDKMRQDYFRIAERIPEKQKELPGWLNRMDDLYIKAGLTPPQRNQDNYVELRPSSDKEFKPIDIEKTIKDVTEKEKQAELFKAMAKARDAAMGMGLGKSMPTDYTMYDKMAEQAKTPLRNIALQNEMEDEQSKRDPNSQISQFARQSLSELGLDMKGLEKLSYAQLEKLYPSVTQALYNKISTKAKIEAAKQEAEEKRTQQKDAVKEKKFNEINKRYEKVLSEQDIAKTYRNTASNLASIESAIRAWDQADDDYKAKAQASFVEYAKIAQRDDSVLRTGDIQILAGGTDKTSFKGLLDKFAAKVKGSDFSAQELKQFAAVVRTIKDIKKLELRSRLNPIIKKAKDEEIDLDQIMDPYFIKDVYSPTIQEKEARLKELEEIEKKDKKK